MVVLVLVVVLVVVHKLGGYLEFMNGWGNFQCQIPLTRRVTYDVNTSISRRAADDARRDDGG